jgi:HEPN domain-containing protein
MNRADLQKLSNMRIREAKILFAAGEHSGAYYLAGYAVECALKACIARGVQRYDFPDKSLAQESYSHDLVRLVKLADLDSELTSSTGANARLDDKLESDEELE